MPDLTAIEFGLFSVLLLLGLVLGWIFRSSRCAKEKIAVTVQWQEQIATQRIEHGRLAEQNKSLMEQISENQASYKDSKMRAQELSDSLKETFERRDILQRQLKEVRGNLEVTAAQRDKLRTAQASFDAAKTGIKAKDEKIIHMRRELQNWQERVPPLIEKFRTRNLEALQLEADLQTAKERIVALEGMSDPNQTRIEPVSSNAITDGLEASNDQYEETSEHRISELGDQEANDDVRLPDYPEDETPESIAVDGGIDFDVTGSDDSGATGWNGEQTQPADNLRLIRGVGPAIEKTLNDLGFFRFSQISEMSEFDIDRVAQQLKGFRSRIYREDWVGQARILHQQKNDDSS